jgi:Fic-DOC domain mobile mystery protein B
MSDLFEIIPGQTPLSRDDLAGLIPGHIQLRSELNEWEQNNITKATQKYLMRRRALALHDPEVLKKIHHDMFDETWKWAGHYRRTETNLGREWHKIPEEVKKCCDDFQYWCDHSTYESAEIAVRLHHRLVLIHPFPNGNGRHARLVADIYIHQQRLPTLTWGAGHLHTPSELRDQYIQALQQADRGDFEALTAFAKS